MTNDYTSISIKPIQAAGIALDIYGLKGSAVPLPGELDFNFRIDTGKARYLLKVSRPDTDLKYLEFQQAILQHTAKSDVGIQSPHPLPDKEGKLISDFTDDSGQLRKVRLLTWMEGRLWSSVNPVNDDFLFSLGEEAAKLTKALQGFEHPLTHREFVWDLAQSAWTLQYRELFTPEKQALVSHFQDRFETIQPAYSLLRKSVVHNDANDNNVVVSEDLKDPKVKSNH